MPDSEIRLPYDDLVSTLQAVLLRLDFHADRSQRCARLFADASRDGVASHGVNRFPRFVRAVRNHLVDPNATPVLVARLGGLERWDGRRGAGNLNAQDSMTRALELAGEHGIGCVALANTNHWMRGGAYGWQAADAGAIGICWTNTMPNLPPWGATDPRVGNNPLIIAVPRAAGHVVLDTAMSQFSYGVIESYRLRGAQLPVPGGFNQAGELTTDPAEIEQSQRALPIGYWKGSGLALMLDMVAAILSAGNATCDLAPDPDGETGLSQVFIAICPDALGPATAAEETAERIIAGFVGPFGDLRYPGQRVLQHRRENIERGIPVDLRVWKQVQQL